MGSWSSGGAADDDDEFSSIPVARAVGEMDDSALQDVLDGPGEREIRPYTLRV